MPRTLIWVAVASALSSVLVLLAGLWTSYRRGRRETVELRRLGEELRALVKVVADSEWERTRGSGGIGGSGGNGAGVS